MSWVKPVIADVPQEVEFVQEWMGNPTGSRKTMWKGYADSLVSRGVARFVEMQVSDKSLDEPPADRMMRRRRAVIK